MRQRHRVTIVALLIAVAASMAASQVSAAQRGSGTGTGGGTGPGTGGGRRGMPPELTASERAASDAKSRLKKLGGAIENLDKAAQRAMPKNVSAADRQQWPAQTEWIASVKGRYAAYAADLDAAMKASVAEHELVAQMARMDTRLSELQKTVKGEAAGFTGLEKAAKSRHDAAIKAIKSVK